MVTVESTIPDYDSPTGETFEEVAEHTIGDVFQSAMAIDQIKPGFPARPGANIE